MFIQNSLNFEIILFHIFAGTLLSSAFLVILSRNPVHSVLFLILSFFNTTLLLLLFQVEFISITLVIIYVGAIAVLFLFVIMMLDLKTVNQNFKEKLSYAPICFFMFLIFLTEVFIFKNISSKELYINDSYVKNIEWVSHFDFITNTQTIGNILYTYYFIFFLIAGIILLIALLGAVSLTLRKNQKYNQQVYKQLSRDANNSIFNYNSKK